MEETVGTRCDGLVAVNPSGTDDADGRLCGIHHTGLYRTGMASEDDVLGDIVGVGLHKESVLHVTGWMAFTVIFKVVIAR